MAVFAPVRMPALDGATEWLGSEPLGSAELRGRVVLVNFWTWTCINWLRQEPYVRAWSRAYRDDGLVVLGVHTPEFSFEHDLSGVRRARSERSIDYPVLVDNDYEVWSAFANRYWPALYEKSERVLQRLLGVSRALADVEGVGVEAEADREHLRTPETYLDAHLVLSAGAAGPIAFRVTVDGEPPGASHGVDVGEDGRGVLREGRMYQLVREHGQVRERTLEIIFDEPGVEAYAFTFG